MILYAQHCFRDWNGKLLSSDKDLLTEQTKIDK